MMRPGFDKPGALPLLIVVIFSLLTLAPSLSSIYNLKLADWTYYPYGARPVPLIKDSAAEFAADTSPVEYRTSWITAAQCRPRGNRMSRSSRSGNNAPTIASEFASVDNKSRLSYTATESSFMFSRRARAFQTYFIQQLDDYQIFTPFSNRSISTETAHLTATRTPSYLSPQSTPLHESYSDNTPHLHNESTPSCTFSTKGSGLQFPPVFDIWQQACRTASDLWQMGKNSPVETAMKPVKWLWKSIEPIVHRDQAASNHPTTLIPHPKDLQPLSNGTSSLPAPPKSATVHSGETADAAVHTSPELRGSCMAVVIGLVVGIMWF
ncbi:hypothetical protein N7532_005760 [Penicillium argentinense]|uniref:Uncharacterized protein n=1 Tax=Penicillium argentinense TaxID=1131581 RepID=A0A9W9KA48_9EURO|nr:uncharacterized protein N7532_005760 [Penicillium argentinense]KAJ5098759.1 hypothetical protein N7532_005760 [Penicillium argentinense]